MPETGFLDLGVSMRIGLRSAMVTQGDFVSGSFGSRLHPDKLSMLGEDPEIVRMIDCLDMNSAIFGECLVMVQAELGAKMLG